MQTCHVLVFFETKFRSIDHLLILGTYEFHSTTSAPGAGGWPCRARGFFVGGGVGHFWVDMVFPFQQRHVWVENMICFTETDEVSFILEGTNPWFLHETSSALYNLYKISGDVFFYIFRKSAQSGTTTTEKIGGG